MISPPADLAGLINTFYIIETDEVAVPETVPAYSAQLLVVVRGRIRFTYADGSTGTTGTVTFNAPQMRSAQCVMEGPLLEVGVSFTHVAWQKLANLPADRVHDRLIPAEQILAPDRIAALEAAALACAEGRIAPDALCTPLAAAVASGRHAIRPDHVAAVEAISRWLVSGFDPPLTDLYDNVSLSCRQLQRISRRFFGVAPAQVLKRFRAHRAAMVLAQPGISEEVFDALMATYFDQAHLIRDIRRYTGRTPSQLRSKYRGHGLLDPAGHGDAGVLLNSPPKDFPAAEPALRL
ncbi:MAG: helix-turn-helix transcriptional regulator [Sphingomonadales bacterium]|nr:helix-turn-helix transcriptional regulator [Sphingomonadales bacterium]NCQ20569.1 helix-turn-helix transcriptional regulator [Sphingomonadales bacterium]NCT04075.1 helix-turn-helix transcriptional regulator [Sphingomonadales bacterium]